MPQYTKLDYTQVIQQAFDESTNRIKVDAALSVDIPGGLEVAISDIDDSIKIGNGNNGPYLKVNNDGSLNISGTVTSTGSSTVTGTVSTNVNGLANFQTSMYTIGTSVVQLTPTPLSNRSSMSIKVIISTPTDIIYIGNSSGVTSSTGYPLFNGDSLQLDLISSQFVYAIGSTSGLKLYVMEIG